ncbi:unnamed protein product [Darwinula stevensoni]|uniref:MBD domain-containing protein n=1 Tax=Darwinula stevensoni TaxID=69355 RepID=A0A7R9AG64_9CRUS|nr:unnamed protein product [Darwinula stevensoni]CAG0903116.1 unnamed protein product [Darwinula stevensoni]
MQGNVSDVMSHNFHHPHHGHPHNHGHIHGHGHNHGHGLTHGVITCPAPPRHLAPHDPSLPHSHSHAYFHPPPFYEHQHHSFNPPPNANPVGINSYPCYPSGEALPVFPPPGKIPHPYPCLPPSAPHPPSHVHPDHRQMFVPWHQPHPDLQSHAQSQGQVQVQVQAQPPAGLEAPAPDDWRRRRSVHYKYPSNPLRVAFVPRGWKREIVNQSVIYITPSQVELCSMEEVCSYLLSAGTCKCGLHCPLNVPQVFCFDPQVPSCGMGSEPNTPVSVCGVHSQSQFPASIPPPIDTSSPRTHDEGGVRVSTNMEGGDNLMKSDSRVGGQESPYPWKGKKGVKDVGSPPTFLDDPSAYLAQQAAILNETLKPGTDTSSSSLSEFSPSTSEMNTSVESEDSQVVHTTTREDGSGARSASIGEPPPKKKHKKKDRKVEGSVQSPTISATCQLGPDDNMNHGQSTRMAAPITASTAISIVTQQPPTIGMPLLQVLSPTTATGFLSSPGGTGTPTGIICLGTGPGGTQLTNQLTIPMQFGLGPISGPGFVGPGPGKRKSRRKRSQAQTVASMLQSTSQSHQHQLGVNFGGMGTGFIVPSTALLPTFGSMLGAAAVIIPSSTANTGTGKLGGGIGTSVGPRLLGPGNVVVGSAADWGSAFGGAQLVTNTTTTVFLPSIPILPNGTILTTGDMGAAIMNKPILSPMPSQLNKLQPLLPPTSQSCFLFTSFP